MLAARWVTVSACFILLRADLTCATAAQRSVLVTNAFYIKENPEYIELVYAISPPGTSGAKMSQIKLAFSFTGDVSGSIGIWLSHSENSKPEAPCKFGLGVAKVQQGRHACDTYPVMALVNFYCLLFLMH
jgi:hypothetical protein